MVTGKKIKYAAILIISALFLIAGIEVVSLLGAGLSGDKGIGAVGSYGDEVWFLTSKDGARVYHKSTDNWDYVPNIQSSSLNGLSNIKITDKWIFTNYYKYDKRTGKKYILPGGIFASDKNYVYIYGSNSNEKGQVVDSPHASRYDLASDKIIPGHLDVFTEAKGRVMAHCEDDGSDWYVVRFDDISTWDGKIKDDIFARKDKNSCEVTYTPNKYSMSFSDGRLLSDGAFLYMTGNVSYGTSAFDIEKQQMVEGESLFRKMVYYNPAGLLSLVSVDKKGYWFISSKDKMLFYGKGFTSSKEYQIKEYKNDSEYYKLYGDYDDGDNIWIVYYADPYKLYMFDKNTGKVSEHQINTSISGHYHSAIKGLFILGYSLLMQLFH